MYILRGNNNCIVKNIQLPAKMQRRTKGLKYFVYNNNIKKFACIECYIKYAEIDNI